MTENAHITLTHLNIRQSISILLAKLILIEILFIIIIIIFYFLIDKSEQFMAGISQNTAMFLIFTVILGVLKISASCYVILQWLNEYYELTPEYILHKRGIFFRKTEHYRLNLVREMKIGESFLGNLFNFATITFYEIRLEKYLDMYLIHNARRYAKIIKELRPQIEIKESHFQIPFKKEDELLPHE